MITSGISKVSLELHPGEFVVVTGESGSGKSTLLNVLSGLDSYEEGEMYINGEETSHYTVADFESYRKKYISNVFQSFNLINSYTVYQNIELPLLINGNKRGEIRDKINGIIAKVGLTDHAHTKCSKLSGGQKQRVAIARALAKETPVILADEPTGNLDSESGRGVANLLKEISQDKLVIVVTHNFEQFKDQATRVVKMSDGKIMEDREVRPYEKADAKKDLPSGDLRPASQLRLGFRNTFNLVPKLLLLLLVFMFLVVSTTAAYTGFKNQGDEQAGYFSNNVFTHYAPERIIIQKADGTPLTDSDFESVAAMEGVVSIERNDIVSDIGLYIENKDFYINGFPRYIENLQGTLDYGRMPENSDEFVAVGDVRYMFNGQDVDSILDKEYTLNSSIGTSFKLTLVGIVDREQTTMVSAGEIYLPQGLMDRIVQDAYRNYSKITATIGGMAYDGNYQYRLVPNAKVPSGQAYVPVDLAYIFPNASPKNKTIDIKVKNTYFESGYTAKVTATFNKYNVKTRIGAAKYEDHAYEIHINNKDFAALFDQGIYQSSVYVAEAKKADETAAALEELGFTALALKDTLPDFGGDEIISIVQIPLLIIFVVGIFFIAYFVTRLILKSRGAYFSILRILGLAKGHLRRIMDIELLTVVTIAYGLVLGVYLLVLRDILPIPMLKGLVEYLTAGDYLLLYAVLLFMAFLLSRRFSRRLFKKAAMATFREEAQA
jgi:ABC-type lipoprotein export system ATPase subunit